MVVDHNVILRDAGADDVADAAIRNNTSSAACRYRNNIIVGFDAGVRRGALAVENGNLFWQVGQAVVDAAGSAIASGALSKVGDPLFLDPERPWLGLRPDSPCWHAGVFIQGAKDRYGRMYPVPSHIGPWAVKQ